jgi:peptide/nickel transport system substrate-binding protein
VRLNPGSSRARRGALIAAVAAVALPAAGCGTGDGGPKPAVNERPGRGGELTVLTPVVPPVRDPHRVVGAPGAMAHGVLFRQLYVHVPGRAEAVPDLAAGPAEVSDDGRTIIVPVRRTGRFGPDGGERITARDVEHGLERALADPVAGRPARRLLGTVEGLGPIGVWRDVPGVTAVADDRLELRLRAPATAEALEGLASPASTPIPAGLPRTGGALPADEEIFSGPYAPADVGVAPLAPGVVRLARNPVWRGESDPRPAYADAITFVPVARTAAAWRTFAGRGLVMGPAAPPEVARIARRRDRGQLAVSPLPITRYVALSPRAPGLTDVFVRRALVAALDREAILRAAGGGALASHYLPPGVPGHDESGGVDGTRSPELREPAGDPRLAAADLRRAGFPDGRYAGPVLRAVRGPSRVDAAIARVARSSWAPLGVRLRVDVLEGTALRAACTDRSGRVAVCLSASIGGAVSDPEALLAPLVRGRAGSRVDEAMAATAELPDGPLRARAWAGINRAAVDRAIGAPWRWDERPLLVSRDVLGAVDERTGTWDLAFTSLDARTRRGQSR